MLRSIRLILSELMFRPLSTMLLIASVAAAASLLLFYQTGSESLQAQARQAEDATRRIQKAMGTNLTLIPAATDLSDYYDAASISATTVDASVIDRLIAQNAVSMNHLILMLESRVEISGKTALLTGIAASEHTPGRPQAKMNDGVQPGTVELGNALAMSLAVAEGDRIDVHGESMEVAIVYVPKGTSDDQRLYSDLADAQRLLNLPNQINKIEALECVSCVDPSAEALPILRQELASVAPELQVQRDADVANARVLQRAVLARQTSIIDRFHAVMLPLVLIVVPVVVGAIMMLNVRDRRSEIGMLRALGKSEFMVASLFIGKAIGLGIVGTLCGVIAGWTLLVWQGPTVFETPAEQLAPSTSLIVALLVGMPLLAALATIIPTVMAVIADPADAMQEAL